MYGKWKHITNEIIFENLKGILNHLIYQWRNLYKLSGISYIYMSFHSQQNTSIVDNSARSFRVSVLL